MPGHEAIVAVLRAGVGGERDDRKRPAGEVCADTAGGFESVEARQLAVHQNCVPRRRGRRLNRLVAVFGEGGLESHLFQKMADDALVDAVVFDDEDAAAEGRGDEARRGGRGGEAVGIFDVGAGEGQGERKRGTLAGSAVHRDFSAHGFDELLGNGEAEAGAAEAAAHRTVGLRERAEQPGGRLGVESDAGVDDRESDPGVGGGEIGAVHAERDRAPVGELDGVAEEVEEDLTEARRVAEEGGRQTRIELGGQGEGLGRGAGAQHVENGAEGGVRGEGDALKLQAAGLDFGEVEDIVEEVEKGVGRGGGGVQMLALRGNERGVAHNAEHAEDAVHRGADLVAHRRQEIALGLTGGVGADAGCAKFAFDDFAAGNFGRQAAIELFGTFLGVTERFDEGDVFEAEADGAAEGAELLAGGDGHEPEVIKAQHRDGRAAQIAVRHERRHQGDEGEIKIREVGGDHRHEEPGGAGRQGGEHEHREQAVGGLTEGEKIQPPMPQLRPVAPLTSVKQRDHAGMRSGGTGRRRKSQRATRRARLHATVAATQVQTVTAGAAPSIM